MSASEPTTNPTKVRIGLAIISLIFVAAAVMVAVADTPVGKAIFFAVAAMTLVRAFLLVRWLKRRSTETAT